ncbi:ubiquitin-like-conjugating enzyme ATG10 [Zerene cesonia]|uniref:ubiquitin-like-conjugating enzyme ATG10 n=1 Tax=Zerene cesonia TaxID=33412 RepID=UPI0018E5309D|nr:ubiquitin-like-conjugating enzyme ATG10 [Zerene cesonia]XP_038215006.1 ubiquitin-like-conjugating enzyme ATG10 [Zerene cesonia]
MDEQLISPEKFLTAAIKFMTISDKIKDKWKLHENIEIHKSYLKKETFIQNNNRNLPLLKAEFVIFYNLSYGVPSFSFNIWDPSGSFLSLEDIRQLSFIEIRKQDFYSVVTQQEHPVLNKPYFIMHPCHTQTLLANLKESKNIIVTFLGLIMPLLNIDLPLEYGL